MVAFVQFTFAISMSLVAHSAPQLGCPHFAPAERAALSRKPPQRG
jgi:hypothetical protein